MQMKSLCWHRIPNWVRSVYLKIVKWIFTIYQTQAFGIHMHWRTRMDKKPTLAMAMAMATETCTLESHIKPFFFLSRINMLLIPLEWRSKNIEMGFFSSFSLQTVACESKVCSIFNSQSMCLNKSATESEKVRYKCNSFHFIWICGVLFLKCLSTQKFKFGTN